MPKRSQSNELGALVAKLPEFQGWTVVSTKRIATLWSNYGSVESIALRSPDVGTSRNPRTSEPDRSIIVKTVSPPWVDPDDADEGHLRKLLSYGVERWFYYNLAGRLPGTAKVATPYAIKDEERSKAPIRLLMEDLSVDYPYPARGSLNLDDTRSVLSWLAMFHGSFWGLQNEEDIHSRLIPPPLEYNGGSKEGVWRQGTYWYLDTRREEFSNIGSEKKWLLDWVDKVDSEMKKEARTYGTLLHGDVKGANIFFARRPERSETGPRKCALYDFQYVGIGLVTRDLVYFLGTTTQMGLVKRLEDEKSLLKGYHSELVGAIEGRKESTPQVAEFLQDHGGYTFDKFWGHWELAIVDWYRFMAGWGFWGNDSWVERRAREITTRWTKRGFNSL